MTAIVAWITARKAGRRYRLGGQTERDGRGHLPIGPFPPPPICGLKDHGPRAMTGRRFRRSSVRPDLIRLIIETGHRDIEFRPPHSAARAISSPWRRVCPAPIPSALLVGPMANGGRAKLPQPRFFPRPSLQAGLPRARASRRVASPKKPLCVSPPLCFGPDGFAPPPPAIFGPASAEGMVSEAANDKEIEKWHRHLDM